MRSGGCDHPRSCYCRRSSHSTTTQSNWGSEPWRVCLQSKRPRNQKLARETAKAIGNSAVYELRAVLKNGKRGERIAALDAMGAIGPDAKDATAQVISLARLDDPAFYAASVSALARIAPDNQQFHDKLLAGLQDKQLTLAAVEALATVKQAIPAVAPELVKLRLAGDKETLLMAMLTHLPLNEESVEALLGCYEGGFRRQDDPLDGFVLPFLREAGQVATPVLDKHCASESGGAKAAAMRFAATLDIEYPCDWLLLRLCRFLE